MRNALRLVLVAQDFPPSRGGIQTYCLELAKVWAAACDDFLVLAPEQRGALEADRDYPFAVRRVKVEPNLFFGAAAHQLARLGPTWSSFHSQWYSALAVPSLERLGRTGRAFVAAHGRELLLRPWRAVSAAQRAYDALRRHALTRAAGVFAVSQFTAGLARELSVTPERLEVHPNGTDPAYFRPGDAQALRNTHGLAPDAKVFLSVARLVARKGVETTLRAFAQVCTGSMACVLIVVGDGPERVRLEQLASHLGVSSRVRFCGAVDARALLGYYQLADVFVLVPRSEPNDVEGFGVVYLEAAACGLPCIGANEGGPSEAIVAGETGFVVDPRSVQQIAGAMLALAQDPALCAELGRQGRKRVVTELNWPNVARRLLASIQARSVRL